MRAAPNTESVLHANSSGTVGQAGEIVLGRYRLGARLGAGGMGVVYRARDERLARDVAVKRIAVEHDPDGRGEREALAAARLSHAGIVALYESGRDGDAIYLVSELVEGPTLAELLRAGELSDQDLVRIGATLCGALAHAHARKVVHRDVKPSNVICPRSEDGLPMAKLTDFGIARMGDHDVLTRTGDVVGTLAYMAPEQARGERVTGAADVYALGVVLYEGLAGINPIRAGNPAATARRVGMRLPPLRRVRRDLPADLCSAIDAAVSADPGARIGLGALRRALEDAFETVTEPHDRTRARSRDIVSPDPDRDRAAGGEEDVATDRRAQASARVSAAAATGCLVAAALAWLGPPPPLAPVAGGALVAAAVLVVPRLAWLATSVALLAWLAVPLPGLALLAAVALVPVPALLAGVPAAWSLPAGAALLGVVGLAGAWPALAGQASRWPARAALGALGGWWLALVETMTTERLALGPPHDALAPDAWESSAVEMVQHALWPLVAGGALGLAALWAFAAAVLPVVVRGRAASLDIIGAAAWAASLAAATGALAQGLVLDPPRGLIAGALAAAAFAVAARAVRGQA